MDEANEKAERPSSSESATAFKNTEAVIVPTTAATALALQTYPAPALKDPSLQIEGETTFRKVDEGGNTQAFTGTEKPVQKFEDNLSHSRNLEAVTRTQTTNNLNNMTISSNEGFSGEQQQGGGGEAMDVVATPDNSRDLPTCDTSTVTSNPPSSRSSEPQFSCLNPKMRLKRQRLQQLLYKTEQQQQQQDVAIIDKHDNSEVASVLVAMKNKTEVVAQPGNDLANSALHRLAEAAQRKQEEEMMEVESGTPTPSGSPSNSRSPVLSFPSIAQPPLSNGKPQNGVLNLASHSEFELTTSNMASGATVLPSPLVAPRNQHIKAVGSTPSPDSAIHSTYYSPSHSPVQSRHVSGFSSPFSLRTTPSLSRNNSDASQYSNSSPLSPSQSLVSPSQSPVQGRHPLRFTQSYPSSPRQSVRQVSLPPSITSGGQQFRQLENDGHAKRTSPMGDIAECTPDMEGIAHVVHPTAGNHGAAAGISRQQLINSPCPVCGDKISGFHYGIFSCESCKGFFKRTVQNKKNYVCVRGGQCPVAIATRKKCPACRFDKCLKTGMKLEAIREDRTRGGRSTYQCSYTLPPGLCPSNNSNPQSPASAPATLAPNTLTPSSLNHSNSQPGGQRVNESPRGLEHSQSDSPTEMATTTIADLPKPKISVPHLLQEIMDVEHLWFSSRPQVEQDGHLTKEQPLKDNDNMSEIDHDAMENGNPNKSVTDMVQTLTIMADKRLYKLVKWCKSLPLFKNILIDDQIALLINAWCELLVFSCCFRSSHCKPGIIKVSTEKLLDLDTARKYGVEKCVEKMLNFTDQLRRLKVDYYEYVSMKVIVLLTSDASGLKEPNTVSDSQEKVVQALQQYTTANYPNIPSKFGELLLRMPELQRVCQVGKEMLCPRQQTSGEFNLLLELLRGDH